MSKPKITDIRSRAPRHRTKSVTRRSLSNIRQIVIHHGMTRRGLGGTNYEAYLRYHVNTHNWSCGGYTYGVEPDGEIKWGYDWTIQTPHVGNANRHSLGIVLPGDFRHEKPTDIQWQRALELTNYVREQLPNNVKVLGHQEVPGYSWKECPAFSMDIFRRDLTTKPTTKEVNWMSEKLDRNTQQAWQATIERWADGDVQRNPIGNVWVERIKSGDMTYKQLIRLMGEEKRRGLK